MQKVINNKTDKIWNPLFTTIFIANACMNLSQQMMNSLVSKYADYLGGRSDSGRYRCQYLFGNGIDI